MWAYVGKPTSTHTHQHGSDTQLFKILLEKGFTRIDAPQEPSPDEMSAEEARRYLIRFLDQQDLDKHEEIYEELAGE